MCYFSYTILYCITQYYINVNKRKKYIYYINIYFKFNAPSHFCSENQRYIIIYYAQFKFNIILNWWNVLKIIMNI